MLQNIEAVLFDLDGTLADSMWMWKEIDIEYLGKYSLDLPVDLQRKIEGMSFSETAVFMKDYFKIEESLEQIQQDWVDMALDKYKHKVPLKPGAENFLRFLKEQNIKTGICTSNHRTLAEAAVKGMEIDPFITDLITSCEAGAGKPAPDIYLKMAERLQVKPENCLVFEDIPAGIQAGLSAGMRVCAMEDEYSKNQREEILQLANYYIQDFEQVLDNTYKVLKESK